jgi:hypothetical protein
MLTSACIGAGSLSVDVGVGHHSGRFALTLQVQSRGGSSRVGDETGPADTLRSRLQLASAGRPRVGGLALPSNQCPTTASAAGMYGRADSLVTRRPSVWTSRSGAPCRSWQHAPSRLTARQSGDRRRASSAHAVAHQRLTLLALVCATRDSAGVGVGQQPSHRHGRRQSAWGTRNEGWRGVPNGVI